jgi:hypothetical protein
MREDPKLWRMASSGVSGRVALERTDVSEELSAFFIRVTRIGELGTTLAVTSNRRTLRRFLEEPHGVTSQKTPFFIVIAVKSSNLTLNFATSTNRTSNGAQFLSTWTHPCSETSLASSLKGTGDYFPWDKAAVAWSWISPAPKVKAKDVWTYCTSAHVFMLIQTQGQLHLLNTVDLIYIDKGWAGTLAAKACSPTCQATHPLRASKFVHCTTQTYHLLFSGDVSLCQWSSSRLGNVYKTLALFLEEEKQLNAGTRNVSYRMHDKFVHLTWHW